MPSQWNVSANLVEDDPQSYPELRQEGLAFIPTSVSHGMQATLEGAWPWEMRQLSLAETVPEETNR